MASEEDKTEESNRCWSGWLDSERSRSKELVDDSEWPEVSDINSYALFMGYLSMGVRGLGFLVVTWTTVVLLGGFVSTISKKDFWCLTIIVLTETAGVFDIFLKEKLSNIWYAFNGLVNVSFATVYTPEPSRCRDIILVVILFALLGAAKVVIQILLLGIILSPLVVVYISGLYVSSVISVWRLIEHDYGNTDENANMKPALDVLYSLALFQGVVYGYRASYSRARKKIVGSTIREYKFDHLGCASVREYLEDTMSGCEKDPTFARGRNLITYAVELMESNSPDKFLSGVRIVDTIFSKQRLDVYKDVWRSNLVKHTLIKHMIGWSSSSPALRKLLQALGSRSPCNRETRGRAARIVKHLAGDICLEQFPRGIQYISSLIGKFEEYSLIEPYQRDWLVEDKEHKWHGHAVRLSRSGDSYGGDLWKGYNDLFLQGMRILRKLAANEENARIIGDTEGLLSKIMAPITSDLLHQLDHDGEWYKIVKGTLKVMRQLVSALGEAGAKIRRDISGNSEVMSTLNRIIRCNRGCYRHKELSMRILTRLYMETQGTEEFIKLLLHRFVVGSGMDEQKGEALAMLSSTGGSNVMIILQSEDDVVSNLSKLLLDVKAERRYRILAAKILEHLCIHYTNGDELCPARLEAMINLMPKLLGEIFPEATETGTGAGFSSSQADIEGQHGGASQANDGRKSAGASEIKSRRELLVVLLSLCLTVCETFISAGPDKARQFSAIHDSSLPRKLRAMVEGTSEPTVYNLRMLKLTSRMAISMAKHEGCRSFRKQDLESLMQVLSVASKNMVPVDGSITMYSATCDGEGDSAMEMKPFRSLASLVEEAKKIVSKYYKAEESK